MEDEKDPGVLYSAVCLLTNAGYGSSHEHWQGLRLTSRREVMSPAQVFMHKAILMTKL